MRHAERRCKSAVLFVETDVTSFESVQAAFAKGLERFGRLTASSTAGLGPVESTLSKDGKPHRPKMFDFVVKVNLYGVFNSQPGRAGHAPQRM